MNTRRFVLLPLVAGLAFAAACSDSGKGPLEPGNGIASGSMSFAYAGDIAGNFSTTGSPTGSVTDEGKTWAAAMRDRDGKLAVYGSKAQQNNLYDIVTVAAPRSVVGTYPISSDCDDDCALVGMFFGMAKGDNAPFDLTCTLTTGSITVASVSDTRIRGSFSGNGSCFRLSGTGVETFDIAVTNGQFDTALLVSAS